MCNLNFETKLCLSNKQAIKRGQQTGDNNGNVHSYFVTLKPGGTP